MTALTLAAVYAPIGFLGGVTGTLFREFAFTLAGAVIISGVIAVTLSPMMCSIFLRHGTTDKGFAALLDRAFNGLANWYGRRLERQLARLPRGDRALRGRDLCPRSALCT